MLRLLLSTFASTALVAQQFPPQPSAATLPPVVTPDPASLPAAVLPTTPTRLEPEIRSITKLHNSMPHYLVGIGIVAGLAGTGASDRGTRQAIINLVRQHGLNVTLADVVAGSTAMVSITCSLPPFAKEGMALDVKLEILGDATSLRGGDLLRAELKGVDGQNYVVAQGPVMVAGFTVGGGNASVSKNPQGTGWVNNGGLVMHEENSSFFSESGHLELRLLNPSFYNVASIVKGIRGALGNDELAVRAVDSGLVRIEIPSDRRTPEFAIDLLNRLGTVRVPIENPAKVVIDQASGTVLAGEGVLISPCVVGLTDLMIAVTNDDEVVQPLPLANGDTERVGRTRIDVQTNSTELKPVQGGATVADLLQNLRSLGLTPAQLISVFQALDTGQFLHAELEIR